MLAMAHTLNKGMRRGRGKMLGAASEFRGLRATETQEVLMDPALQPLGSPPTPPRDLCNHQVRKSTAWLSTALTRQSFL